MDDPRADDEVLHRIQKLVEHEHRLLEQGQLASSDEEQLTKIQVQLDQCWDLLRQRRALRETGRDEGDAHVRPPGVVEKYIG